METKIQSTKDTKIKHFTDLDAWREAHKLTLQVYKNPAVGGNLVLRGAQNKATAQLRPKGVIAEARRKPRLVQFPPEEKYGLTSQLRRSVVSTESNIAEGFNRYHFGERVNFYYNARGSLGEAQSQLITAEDLGFLNQQDFKRLWDQAVKVDIILNGLIAKTHSFKEK